MFLVVADGKTILYTGDFRSNGRKNYEKLIQNLPTKVDVLICEGTMLSRDEIINITEQELETQVLEIFKKKTGPIFVMQANTNIDRIVTMFKAAKRCDRIFLQELYMAEITSAIGGNIPNPKSFSYVKVFITQPLDKENFKYKMFNEYRHKKIGKAGIKDTKFVMNIRSSMKRYLISLKKEMSFDDGLLVYSMWEGYKKQKNMKEFLEFAESSGLEIVSLHTSGHADIKAIIELIERVNPELIMPVHTENSKWFVEMYCHQTGATGF